MEPDNHPEARISGLDAHLGYWLRFVSNHVSYAFSRKVEAHGITVAEWAILRELFEINDASPSTVADRLGMTRGAISKLVERLVAKSLVGRKHSKQDRRRQTLTLTRTGRMLVPDLAALADSNDAEFFGHLTLPERRTLENLMREIVRRRGLSAAPID
jgi:DNA-binding MarR family transcriptional regulator